jgi:NAD(P)-dependent dehydrogenase (short-subunit alcohol dehydrogenase family)
VTETILISGGGRGLGLALASRFLQAGFHVFAGEHRPSSGLLKLGGQFPETLTVVPLDVTSMDSIRGAVERVAAQTPALDILVNNAGINLEYARATLDGLDLADLHLEQTMAVNVFGPLRLSQQFHPLLARGRLKVLINISSEAGSIAGCGRDREFAYCMSKAALNMQTKLLHNALSPQGFRVLSIHPGWVQSDMGGKQATVPADEAAQGIFQLALKARAAEEVIYLDYRGNALQW